MSNPTLEAPSTRGAARSPARARAVPGAVVPLRLLPWRWLAGAAALGVLAALVVGWAGTRPGYDPYGWLVWGRLAVRLKLDTNGAPSWKPLPFLFTVPYAVFGRGALWLWMVTSVAVSLSGPVFAWRIAFRLTNADPERRYAAYASGLFAALIVLGLYDAVGRLTYTHYVLSAESDTMIVALCLAAIDCHLSARHRWAFWAWWLAALGRPEVWPFLAVAGGWLWRAQPRYRGWVLGAGALLGFLWFGIPGLTSKSVFTAANIAENSPRQVHGNRVLGTLQRFAAMAPATVWATAALTTAGAVMRRDRRLLALAAGAAVWLLIEIGFALRGYPSVPRYMFEPGAVVGVLAGVFVGWLILALPPLLRRAARAIAPGWLPAALTWAAVLAIAGSMLAAARFQYHLERQDLVHERTRTLLIDRLADVVRGLGRSRILACGTPNVPIEYQSVLAWYMSVKVGELYVDPKHERLHPRPLVNLYPVAGAGWKVFPSHVPPARASRCGGLRLVYRR
jgi:hypothetical protein